MIENEIENVQVYGHNSEKTIFSSDSELFYNRRVRYDDILEIV